MPSEKAPLLSDAVVDEMAKAIQRLADQRASVGTQAERLNACIQRFESWIAQVPGRVETVVYLSDPHSDGGHAVRISRDGKQWHISVSWYFEGDDDRALDWKPLREVGIELKLLVLPNLPKLVVAMADSQEQLKSKIDAVASGFEKFAQKAGIPREGI